MWANTVLGINDLKEVLTLTRVPPLITGTPIPVIKTLESSNTSKWFFFVAESTEQPDNVSIVQPNDIPLGNPGRWVAAGFGYAANIPLDVVAILQRSQEWEASQRSKLITLSSGGDLTINARQSNSFLVYLDFNTNIVPPTNGLPNDKLQLTLIQPATPRVLSFDSNLWVPNGIAINISTAPGAIIDLFFQTHNGTTWRCAYLAAYLHP